MDQFPQIIFVSLLFGLWLFAAIKMGIRHFRSRRGKVRSVKAKVTDKFRSETFDKYHGSGKVCQYRVVFEAEGKRLSFAVSEFSYGGYCVGETGTLKYRGDRLIDFH